jgi:GTPase SAR1 family protein
MLTFNQTKVLVMLKIETLSKATKMTFSVTSPSAISSVPKTSASPPNLSTNKNKSSSLSHRWGRAGETDGVMKHKSTQVLEVEKALGFELEDAQFEVNEEGEIILLAIANQKLQKDADVFSELKSLTTLNLMYSDLEDISFLKNLKQLKTINLSNNKIVDMSPISDLEELIELNLEGNLIHTVKPLMKLSHLRWLSLKNNKIVEPKSLRWVGGLVYLNLTNNLITNLTSINGFFLNDKLKVKLKGNPLTIPPIHVVDQGRESIRAYFIESDKSFAEYVKAVRLVEKLKPFEFQPNLKVFQGQSNQIHEYTKQIQQQLQNIPKELSEVLQKALENIPRPLNEVRVIFLGQGQTGKTTLKKQLLGFPIPEVETQTDGIDIDVWQPEELDGIKLRLWDFGGQEIQHSVHKLFLQDNCVYVLLLNKRQDQQSDGNLIYWLNHIRSFGKNSPVLIVENFIDTVNGIDENSTPDQIAEHGGLRNEIKQHYHSESAPLDYVGISAKKGYNLETFKQKLYHWATEENNRGSYSPRWLAAKNHIEERITGGTEFGGLSRNNYITKETFDLECEQVEIIDPNAQNTILGVMLRLGVAFYFKKSENRKNWLVLNPEWVTVGIYSLILHPKVKELNGRLLRSDLEEILVNDVTHSFFSKRDYTFSEDELGYLLSLMQGYELCYTPDQNEFFLPTGFVRNYNSQFRNENPDAVAFFIEYDTLPQAIWFKFLVRLFKRRVVKQYWQEGIEVAVPNAKGLVEFLPLLDKKIKLWVSGETDNSRIELMRLLRNELDFVNEEFSNIQFTPKLFTEDKQEINYADAISALYQNEPIKRGFEIYSPLPMLQAVDTPEQTLVNVYRELQKTNKRIDNFMQSRDEFLLEIAKHLQKSGMVNLIINQNSNVNINENRFELPRETNEFEGKLNFLIEELKDREVEQKLLKDLLEKIEELRLIPTKEEAVKKGFYERFKKFGEYLKTGTDLTKSLKEIGNMVNVEDIKRGIDLILESMK